MRFRFAFAATLAAFSVAGVHAHDVVLRAQSGNPPQLTLRYGHPGDWQLFDAYKLLSLDASTGSGQPASLLGQIKRSAEKIDMKLPPSTCLVSASYDNGFWVKRGDSDYRNARRTEVEGTAEALGSFKFAKALTRGATPATCPNVVGHRLELILVKEATKADPIAIVEVRWEGKPLADAGVEIGDGETVRKEEDIPRHKTDAAGLVRLETKRGWQVVGVDHKVPPRNAQLADYDMVIATLSFWRGD